MARARMSDRVRLPDGEVATLDALNVQGRLTFSHSDAITFSGRGKPRAAYFAGVDGLVVEIAKRDYDAHAPKGVYGEWCRDPQACAHRGYCPKDPTCAD